MKRKRLLCVVLALALLLSAQSAAAAAQTGNIRSMVITANTRLPTIDVTVPGSAWIFLNPYKVPVLIDEGETNDQIICAPCYIMSQSDVPLDVDVKVTGAVYPDSDMTLAAFSTRGSGSSRKSAFVYFEIQSADLLTGGVEWDDAFDANKHIVITDSAAGAAKKNVLTLSATTVYGELTDGCFAAFRLTGDAVAVPSTPWTVEDGLNVEIAFTFTPVPYV